jgi:hypothetical protein
MLDSDAYACTERLGMGNRGNSRSRSRGDKTAMRKRRSVKVFICYCKQDYAQAQALYGRLSEAGVDAWIDRRKLVLGDDFEHEIKKAVIGADAFVACLRPGFDDIGFRQKEVRWGIEALQLRPPGRGFIIPFIIQPCDLPAWCTAIHAGSDLSAAAQFEEVLRALEKHCGWRRRKTFPPKRRKSVKDASMEPSPPESSLSSEIESGVESAEAYESIGDVWSAAKQYEKLVAVLQANNDTRANEMRRRAKKCRSAAASIMRGD